MIGTKVAFIETAGSALITPMQLGPIIRIPCPSTTSISRCSSDTPSPPTSRKPAVITMTPFTPTSPHASTAATAWSRGTTITARSTASGTSPMVGYARTERTEGARGFTG